MTALLRGWLIHRDIVDRNLRNRKRRLPAVPGRHFGVKTPLRMYDAVGVGAVVAMFAFALLVAYLKMNPSPPDRALLQVGHVRSCAHARELGVAPLIRGQPGYRPHLDADGDGIACEFHFSHWLSSVIADIWPSR